MGEHTQTLSDNNFDESVIKSKVPVLVDFWAEWVRAVPHDRSHGGGAGRGTTRAG